MDNGGIARFDRPFPLMPVVQRYSWGKTGQESLVGRLSGLAVSEPTTPFAELWVGAHRSFPSDAYVGNKKVPFDALLDQRPEILGHPEILGQSPKSATTTDLPFLFKILSVDSPLSIQIHPDRENAETLRTLDPAHYPDNNHKPEVAVAISEVELVRGFRPLEELAMLGVSFPHLLTKLPFETLKMGGSRNLQALLASLFRLSDEERTDLARHILNSSASSNDPNIRWFHRAADTAQGNDPGLIMLLLLRCLRLTPGDAVYIPPHVPHAYLCGDLAECMTNSDNVIRAGLTPKFIDRESFLKIVDLTPSSGDDWRAPFIDIEAARCFKLPVGELRFTRLSRGAGRYLIGKSCGELVFALNAHGKIRWRDGEISFNPGEAYFVPAGCCGAEIEFKDGEVFLVGSGG